MAMWAFVTTLRPSSVSSVNFYIFIFFSETTKQISTKLGRNVRQVVFYQICEFGADLNFNMAAMANYAFWLVQV